MTPVTICMPTYNGATFLRESIESALAQTFEKFELVIVDDASTDGTVDIARTICSIRRVSSACLGSPAMTSGSSRVEER